VSYAHNFWFIADRSIGKAWVKLLLKPPFSIHSFGLPLPGRVRYLRGPPVPIFEGPQRLQDINGETLRSFQGLANIVCRIWSKYTDYGAPACEPSKGETLAAGANYRKYLGAFAKRMLKGVSATKFRYMIASEQVDRIVISSAAS
jgi:hypothetical protein